MASTAIALQLRYPKTRSIKNPIFFQLFSSSSTPDPSDTPSSSEPQSQSESPNPFQSVFSDIKASLKQPQGHSPPQSRKPFSTPLFTERPRPSKIASLEKTRKLFEFRHRSTVPPPGETPSQNFSFKELYKRNAQSRAAEGQNNDESSASAVTKSGNLSFGCIRESLKQMKEKNQALERGDPSRTPSFPRLPFTVFGKEMIKNQSPESAAMKIELNERLRKLREIEEKETESRIGGITFKDVRERLVKLQEAMDAEKARKSSITRLQYIPFHKRNEQSKAAEGQNNDESSAPAVTKDGKVSFDMPELKADEPSTKTWRPEQKPKAD